MAEGAKMFTDLILRIDANTAELKQGLQQANQQVSGFANGLNKLKGFITGAFAVGAIVGAGKALFEFATGIDDLIGKIDDLGASFDAVGDAAKVKAIADVFGLEVDPLIKAANGSAKQLGISFDQALTYLQQGLALAGTDQAKYLKAIEAQAAGWNNLHGSADKFFTIVTDGFRNSTDWESQLRNGLSESVGSFADLASEMNEGQLIQQELINSSTELNKVWTRTFDGTGDLVDQVKIGFNNLAIGAIKGLRDIANWFIELYNNSMLFRGVIQAIILNFEMMWNAIKFIFNNFFTVLKGAGEMLKAVFTGNFSEIPGLIRKYFNESVDNAKSFGIGIADKFKTAFDNTVNAKPVELFKDSEVESQGVKAAKSFKKGYDSEASSKPIEVKKTDITTMGQPVKADTGKIIQQFGVDIEKINAATAAQRELNTATTDYGIAALGTSEGATEAFTTLFDSVNAGNKDATRSFKDTAKAFGNSVKSMLAQLLALTIANAIKNAMTTSGNPILGLVLAGIATAGVMALFSAIPSFSTGGQTKAPYFFAGEDGARKELVVNSGGGSRVFNHSQSKSMLAGANGGTMELATAVRGEDLYFVLQEVNRRRGNSI